MTTFDWFNEIDTHKKAYWLGMIWSHGCLRANGRLTIGLANRDKYLLDKLQAFMGNCGSFYMVKGGITTIQGVECHAQDFFQLNIFNRTLASNLRSLGFCYKKDRTIPNSLLISPYLNSFVLGLFDGNATVVRYNKWFFTSLLFTFNHKMLNQINTIFHDSIGIPRHQIKEDAKTVRTFLRWSNMKEIDAIRSWIYSDYGGFLDQNRDRLFGNYPQYKPHGPQKCIVDGCDRKRVGHGYCDLHWRRNKMGIPLDGPVKKPRKDCMVEGCKNKYCARGYCSLHYQRNRMGTPIDGPVKKPGKGCVVEGCQNKHSGHGYCSFHYQRNRLGIPFDKPVKKRREGCVVEGCQNKHLALGYCSLHYQRNWNRK